MDADRLFVFGFTNYRFYSDGTTTWFATRAERDEALGVLRAHAVDKGLSMSAAHGGIVPVKRKFKRAVSRAKWLGAMDDAGKLMNGGAA